MARAIAISGLWLFLVAASQGEKLPGQPEPLTDPGTWVRTNDYPVSELQRGVSGVSAFALAVDRAGMVTECVITGTSGSEVLDATACALLKARAAFKPATDEKGRAVASTWRNRVRWLVPGIEPIPFAAVAKTETKVALVINEMGKAERCDVLQDRRARVDNDEGVLCLRAPMDRQFPVLTNLLGKRIKYRFVFINGSYVEHLPDGD